jgi:hypothetical protein
MPTPPSTLPPAPTRWEKFKSAIKMVGEKIKNFFKRKKDPEKDLDQKDPVQPVQDPSSVSPPDPEETPQIPN